MSQIASLGHSSIYGRKRFYYNMIFKYRYAVLYPWLPIAPDSPKPE